jgi:predicted Mrr-cat superfamily restriction endonuclease
MNIEGKTLWQVAAGNGKNTHYAKQCLQQDVVVLGPGRYGAWPECKMPMLADTKASPMWTTTKAGIIKRFAEDIKPGDIVVLRVGTQYAYGVGEVVGNYGFSNQFSNVQGWDLQHYRRVRWLWHQDSEPEAVSPD